MFWRKETIPIKVISELQTELSSLKIKFSELQAELAILNDKLYSKFKRAKVEEQQTQDIKSSDPFDFLRK